MTQVYGFDISIANFCLLPKKRFSALVTRCMYLLSSYFISEPKIERFLERQFIFTT